MAQSIVVPTVESLVYSAGNMPALDSDALETLDTRTLIKYALLLLTAYEVRHIRPSAAAQRRARDSNTHLVRIDQELRCKLRQHALDLFVELAWRQPRGDELCSELDRSSLLIVVNAALEEVGFDEPLAYKSRVWRNTVARLAGTQDRPSNESPNRKAARPLRLVDLRTHRTPHEFNKRVRDYLLAAIGAAQAETNFDRLDSQ